MASRASVGTRIRRFRLERGMTATQLAERAGVSKSYISELESEEGDDKKPSAEVIYAIAKALGVAMSDLLGRPIITDVKRKRSRSRSLIQFAERERLPEADIRMLEQIQFRGDPPKSPERWAFIYQAIRNSAAMDK